jgi:hypothetical protein
MNGRQGTRDAAGAAQEETGPRFGVRSMSAPLRRVLLRSPSVTGDFAAAAWRSPDPDLLARQHESFGQLLTDLGCEVEVAPILRLAPPWSRRAARCMATTARRSRSRAMVAPPA